MPYISQITNPFQPNKGRLNYVLKQNNLTISNIVESQKIDLSRPTLCLLNDKPILRDDWDNFVSQDDILIFITLPLGGGGGGGSNPLNIVLMVALVVLTVVTYGAAAGAWGAVIGGICAAGVSIGGSILINALVPPPKPSLNGMTSSLASQSPTYSLQAQGNQARLGNPIPVIYGRHLIYPDFASEPYYGYVNNEQYLYQLHCIGQGEYDIEQIRIEDTPISSFEEITYQIIRPNEKNTLFRDDVVTSTEVAGQELLKDVLCGPFVLNPIETKVDIIEIDMAFQRGVYYANDNGTMGNLTIQWRIEVRKIDEEENPIGNWIVIGTESITSNSHNGIYKTYKYGVDKGRYELRAMRLDIKNTTSQAGHEIRWAAARGFVVSNPNYGNVTLMAVKMRATNNLSQRSSRMLNCIVTRKLPSWSAKNAWTDSNPTQSIAWALADILKAQYGAKLSDKSIDLEALYQLDKIWQDRGDSFNGIFDSKLTVYEALSRVAKVGRAVVFLQGGIVRFVRDEAKHIPVALFGPRNIVKNSLSIQYIMPSEDTADSVCVQYFSDRTWKPAEIVGSFQGSASDKTATVELFGCTNKEQALREAVYMALANRYRRRVVTFSTELEGLIPSYGDLISITHDMPKWGVGGEVVYLKANILGLSEPVFFENNEKHFIVLRSKSGGICGPYLVKAGFLNTEVQLMEPVDFQILTGSDCERTHFAFGKANKWGVPARVIGIHPRSNKVEITAVIEDNRVHQEGA